MCLLKEAWRHIRAPTQPISTYVPPQGSMAAFLEDFIDLGKNIFFNAAAPSINVVTDMETEGRHQQNLSTWSLPYGATLNFRNVRDYSTGVLVDSKYFTSLSTAVFRGKSIHHAFARGFIDALGDEYEPVIISNDSKHPLLAQRIQRGTNETTFGNIVVGSMTTSDMHSPQPDANILRTKILENLCD